MNVENRVEDITRMKMAKEKYSNNQPTWTKRGGTVDGRGIGRGVSRRQKSD
jgi:hypothetical protein